MQSEIQLLAMAKLLQTDTGTLINSCQRDEVESGWPWDFLFSNFVLYSAAPQSAGTVTVTQGSPIVNGNGTAFAAVTNAQSQISISTSNIAIPVASIQTSTQLTLTSNWMGANLSNVSYSLRTSIYSVVGFIEVYNVRQIVDLMKTSREEINRRDPARLASGGAPSTEWAPAGFDASGNMQIELWEVPSAVYPYVCEGKLAAATMVNNSDLPQIPTAVLLNKAMWKSAMALYQSGGDARYKQIADTYYAVYTDELQKAQAADSRRQQQRYITQPQYRLGVDIYSTHDFAGVLPGENY